MLAMHTNRIPMPLPLHPLLKHVLSQAGTDMQCAIGTSTEPKIDMWGKGSKAEKVQNLLDWVAIE